MPTQPPVAAADIFTSTITGLLLGQTIQTVMNWVVTNPSYGAATAAEVSDDLNTYIAQTNGLLSLYATCAPTNWQCVTLTSQRTTSKALRSVQRVASNTVAGTGGAANTPNLAMVILRRTDNAGKSQRSILHLPAPTTTSTFVNGVLTAGQITINLAFANRSIQSFTGATTNVVLAPCVAHRVKGQTTGYDLLTSAAAQASVRTERRRNIGVGI